MAVRGRPKKGEERPTVQVRFFEDHHAAMYWIARIERKSTAQILEDLIGDKLAKAFSDIRPHAEAIKAAEDAARAARGLEPTPPLPA